MPNAADFPLADRLDAALPQTQCTRCGYPRCRAYAEALARGEADVDQCPPGGETTIRALAQLLGVAPKPLNPAFGEYQPRQRARIDEARCIGCRKCLEACPLDAIVGAEKWMHTVIAAQCSGCALCVAPCPVDCIDMVPVSVPPSSIERRWPDYGDDEVNAWRVRAQARFARLARHDDRRMARRARNRASPGGNAPSRDQIRTEIQAAIERVRRKQYRPKTE